MEIFRECWIPRTSRSQTFSKLSWEWLPTLESCVEFSLNSGKPSPSFERLTGPIESEWTYLSYETIIYHRFVFQDSLLVEDIKNRSFFGRFPESVPSCSQGRKYQWNSKEKWRNFGVANYCIPELYFHSSILDDTINGISATSSSWWM